MSDAPAAKPPVPVRRRRISFKDLLIRVWSLLILIVVAWSVVMAIRYMIHYVLAPAELPAWVRQGQPPLQETLPWSDLTAGLAGTPISHFHKVEARLRPDTSENCTVSGCHQPLPHTRSKEVRAFANLHVTFVSCGLCHDKTITGPVQAGWCDKATGRPCAAPPSLLLMRQLEVDADKIAKTPGSEQAMIVNRLSALLQESGPDELLESQLLRIRATEPGSPVWRNAISQLGQEVAKHNTGEYGAKLAKVVNETDRARQRNEMAGLTREWLSAAKGSPERQQARQRIHEQVIAEPTGCVACHGGQTSRIDYAALEYPPSRQQALRLLPVAMLVQQNRQRQPFYLPGMVDQTTTRPEK